jgi:hypothetical protein
VHILAQLAADHRELSQRRIQQLRLQMRIAVQHEAENRHQQQKQRKQRQEPVAGDQRRQVAALVIDELVNHSQRETRPPVAALKAV